MKYILPYLDSTPKTAIVIAKSAGKMYLETLTLPTQPAEKPPKTIASVIAEMSAPWITAGMHIPPFTVLEVARALGLSPQSVINIVSAGENELPVELQDKSGRRVNGNMREAAMRCAPMKRVAKLAQNEQNPYNKIAFDLGLQRLHLQPNTR